MKAVLKKVGEPPMLFEGDLSYEYVSGLVGGYIQMVPLGPEIDVVCHEEGMYAGPDGGPLPHNAAGYLGDIMILATDTASGEWRSMTDEEVRKAIRYLEVFKDARHPILDGDPCLPGILVGEEADRAIREKTEATLSVWDSL